MSDFLFKTVRQIATAWDEVAGKLEPTEKITDKSIHRTHERRLMDSSMILTIGYINKAGGKIYRRFLVDETVKAKGSKSRDATVKEYDRQMQALFYYGCVEGKRKPLHDKDGELATYIDWPTDNSGKARFQFTKKGKSL